MKFRNEKIYQLDQAKRIDLIQFYDNSSLNRRPPILWKNYAYLLFEFDQDEKVHLTSLMTTLSRSPIVPKKRRYVYFPFLGIKSHPISIEGKHIPEINSGMKEYFYRKFENLPKSELQKILMKLDIQKRQNQQPDVF